jgi:hypothetical protein
MQGNHTPGPWYYESSMNDYEGHHIMGDGKCVASEMGLRIFSKNWPEEYMILLD